jgi:hypothetical protein
VRALHAEQVSQMLAQADSWLLGHTSSVPPATRGFLPSCIAALSTVIASVSGSSVRVARNASTEVAVKKSVL